MTTVDVIYKYGAAPTEAAAQAIARLREVYGIRRVELNERERTVHLEYDSTRLTESVVHQLLRRAGVEIVENVQLYAVPVAVAPV